MVGRGIEPPQQMRLIYSQWDSPPVQPYLSTQSGSRTHTETILSRLPLPIGIFGSNNYLIIKRAGRQRDGWWVGGVAASPSWCGRIRTFNQSVNSRLRCHCATHQGRDILPYLALLVNHALDWDFSLINSRSSIMSYAQLYRASSCFVKWWEQKSSSPEIPFTSTHA